MRPWEYAVAAALTVATGILAALGIRDHATEWLLPALFVGWVFAGWRIGEASRHREDAAFERGRQAGFEAARAAREERAGAAGASAP